MLARRAVQNYVDQDALNSAAQAVHEDVTGRGRGRRSHHPGPGRRAAGSIRNPVFGFGPHDGFGGHGGRGGRGGPGGFWPELSLPNSTPQTTPDTTTDTSFDA